MTAIKIGLTRATRLGDTVSVTLPTGTVGTDYDADGATVRANGTNYAAMVTLDGTSVATLPWPAPSAPAGTPAMLNLELVPVAIPTPPIPLVLKVGTQTRYRLSDTVTVNLPAGIVGTDLLTTAIVRVFGTSYTVTITPSASSVTFPWPAATAVSGQAAMLQVMIPVDDGAEPPSWTVDPSISGTAEKGQTLTGVDGTVVDGTVSARQWLRDGVAISGETGSTYVLALADVGAAITFRVTAVGPGGSADATSAATVAVLDVVDFVQAANLFMHFEPIDLTGADTTGQATWTDRKSGMVASVTGGGQPTLKVNAVNSRRALRCAGNQWMDLGRPTALVNAIAGDFTIMIVCSNLVAGANVVAGMFGAGLVAAELWMVLNTANIGVYGSTTQYRANPLAATDLYVMFYSGRRATFIPGTSVSFPRTLAGVNNTSFIPNSSPGSSGSENFGIGSTRVNSTVNGNTYSFKGDILGIYGWNTNLAYVDITRQTKRVFDYFGKTQAHAAMARFPIKDGDSITQGIDGNVSATGNYPNVSAGNLGLGFGQWTNNGRTAGTMTQLAADYAFQYTGIMGADALGTGVIFTLLEYTNERGLSSVYTATDSWGAQSKAINPSAMTALMNSVAIGGSSNGDQVSLGGATSAIGLHREAYAAAYRASHPNFDILIDTAADPDIGIVGSNPYSGHPTTYWGASIIHPNATGYGILGGLDSAAIAAYI